MKKKSLAEMAEIAKKNKFPLPHNVKCKKQLMPNGKWSYVFRHDELGELGRILVLPHGAQTQLSCEVVGDPDDPLTAKRKMIFEPISRGVLNTMTMACGDGEGEPKPYVSPKEEHVIKSMHYPCKVCNATAAMLIFAPDADTPARLEDYARLMYMPVKKLNVPTWIVGTETENIVNGEDLRKSLVLKVHPNHGKVRIMTPDELMDTVDKLLHMHCKK